jgi:hypothetical protein
MREALNIPKSVDILDFVHSLSPEEEETAQEKLRVIERRAMLKMVPQPGLEEIMVVSVALVTQQCQSNLLVFGLPGFAKDNLHAKLPGKTYTNYILSIDIARFACCMVSKLKLTPDSSRSPPFKVSGWT